MKYRWLYLLTVILITLSVALNLSSAKGDGFVVGKIPESKKVLKGWQSDKYYCESVLIYGTEIVLNDPSISKIENPKPASYGVLVNGSKHGNWVFWDAEKNYISTIGMFNNNVKDGVWLWLDENGNIKATGIYKNGKPYKGTFEIGNEVMIYKDGMLVGKLLQ